jgi:hypothetical protein
MADVNAKIGVQIDTSAALAELKALQRQLANFHSSVAKGSAASAAAQKNLQYNLLNAINSTVLCPNGASPNIYGIIYSCT